MHSPSPARASCSQQRREASDASSPRVAASARRSRSPAPRDDVARRSPVASLNRLIDKAHEDEQDFLSESADRFRRRVEAARGVWMVACAKWSSDESYFDAVRIRAAVAETLRTCAPAESDAVRAEACDVAQRLRSLRETYRARAFAEALASTPIAAEPSAAAPA